MTSIDLSTTYLGLRLANPFVAGASPLSDHLDTVRRLEDGGCAAIVLHSLFEEQISQRDTGRIHHMDPLDRQFATVVLVLPGTGDVRARTWTNTSSTSAGSKPPSRFRSSARSTARLQKRG